MTLSTFDRYFLRRGETLADDLLTTPDPKATKGLNWALRKSAWRRRFG